MSNTLFNEDYYTGEFKGTHMPDAADESASSAQIIRKSVVMPDARENNEPVVDEATLAMAKAYTDEKAGGGLPVVELTSTLTSTDQTLSTEDCAKLGECANMGTPIILTANVDIGDGEIWRVNGFASFVISVEKGRSPRYYLKMEDDSEEYTLSVKLSSRILGSSSWSGICLFTKTA